MGLFSKDNSVGNSGTAGKNWTITGTAKGGAGSKATGPKARPAGGGGRPGQSRTPSR
jgi:hypothetical protein